MSDLQGSRGKLRRDSIMQLLKQQGRVSVQEIVERFDCSEATARRDLDVLEKTEPIIRTIGGALYDGLGTASAKETSFSEKKSVFWLEKEAVAQKAASLIEEGDIVGLSGGTTTYLIAKAIKSIRGITVVTNAVNIAVELSDCEDIQVLVTGGIMRGKSFELCGPLAEKTVEGLHIGKMFLGIDGITATQGVTTYNELEAQIGKLLISRAKHTYAVFDHSKVGRASLFSVAPLASLYACVTDRDVEPSLSSAFDEAGVRLYVANASK